MGLLDKHGGAPAQVEVECYAGYRSEERPLRFRLGGEAFEVEQIVERWYEPGRACFLVRAAGATYLLCRDEDEGSWRLESRRRGLRRGLRA